MTTALLQTPIGPLTLHGGVDGLTALAFGDEAEGPDAPELAAAATQLEQYFAGDRDRFEVDLDLRGTPFQREVWDLLLAIPHGETTTYSDLATRMGRPRHVRAVAAAVGRTPVPIIVPCHRVLARDGALTGYRGGLPVKRALLDLEGAA